MAQELTLKELQQKNPNLLTPKDEVEFYQNYVKFSKDYDKLSMKERDTISTDNFVIEVEKKLQEFQLKAIERASAVLEKYAADKDRSNFDAVITELKNLDKIPCLSSQLTFLNTGATAKTGIYQNFLKYQHLFVDAIKKKSENLSMNEKEEIKEFIKLMTYADNYSFKEINTYSLAKWFFKNFPVKQFEKDPLNDLIQFAKISDSGIHTSEKSAISADNKIEDKPLAKKSKFYERKKNEPLSKSADMLDKNATRLIKIHGIFKNKHKNKSKDKIDIDYNFYTVNVKKFLETAEPTATTTTNTTITNTTATIVPENNKTNEKYQGMTNT